MADRYKALALDYVKMEDYSGTLESVRKEVFRDFRGRVLLFKLPWARSAAGEEYRAVLIYGYDPDGAGLEELRKAFSGPGAPEAFHFTRGKEGLLVMNMGKKAYDFASLVPALSAYRKEYFSFTPLILEVPEKHLVFKRPGSR